MSGKSREAPMEIRVWITLGTPAVIYTAKVSEAAAASHITASLLALVRSFPINGG